MTNLQSIGGAAVWMMVSCLLMAATLEPVTLGKDAEAQTQQISSAAMSPAATDSAAL